MSGGHFGYCVDCKTHQDDVMMVFACEQGSGPGMPLYACLPHARRRAAYPLAPDWLREDVAARDVEGGDGTI